MDSVLNNTSATAVSNISPSAVSACGTGPDSDASRIAKSFALSVLLLVSLLGNILVVVVIYKNKHMRTTVNYFIVNMACSDLIIPIIVLPRKIFEVSSGSDAWRSSGAFGVFACKFVLFLSDITPPVSVLSLVFMTLDRFCAVAFPLKATLIPPFVRPLLIVVTWVVSMAFFAPYLYAFNVVPRQGKLYCTPTWDTASHNAFMTTICVVFIIIPFALLTGLYTAILVILRRNRGMGEQMERERKRREKINTTVIKLALTIVLVFAICWGPYNAALFVLAFVWDWKPPASLCSWPTLWFVSQYLAYATPAMNPLIYFFLNENYRAGLKRAVRETLRTKSCQQESTVALRLLSSTRIRKERQLENKLHSKSLVKSENDESGVKV